MLAPAAGEIEDPLGLDVENSVTNFPEEQLQVILASDWTTQIT